MPPRPSSSGAVAAKTEEKALVAELGLERRTLIKLGDTPPVLRDAFVLTEDKRFFKHGGIDWIRVFGAALHDLRTGSWDEGFSTLTMQLARNIFSERISREKTLVRKLKEAKVARQIEQRGLLHGERRRAASEVALAGRFHAPQVGTELRDVEIEREDLVLRERHLEIDGEQCLLHLARHRPLRLEEQILGKLLRDRAATGKVGTPAGGV